MTNDDLTLSGEPLPLQTENIKKAILARAQLHSIFGQIVLTLSGSQRYRHHSLADLEQLVLNPLVKDRIAVANAAASDADPIKHLTPAGIAIWASVNEEVDGKIKEQIRAGVFPIKLNGSDWASGEIVWLLDVIAPTCEAATAILSNFEQVSKANVVNVHPIISRLVDEEVLNSLITASKAHAA